MKHLLLIAVVCLSLLLIYDFLFIHPHHIYFKWQGWKGFYALLGLFGGVFLMLFSKALGKFLLYRNEHYYKD